MVKVDEDGRISLIGIEFRNLKSITVFGANEDLCSYFQSLESSDIPFHQFCALNNNLKHLNIEINHDDLYQSHNNYQIKWFTKFYATTAIETCKISIATDSHKTGLRKLIHWREGGFNQVQLFGKVLNEEENRFFV